MKKFRITALIAICLIAVFSLFELYAQEPTEQEDAQRQALIDVAAEITNGNFEALDQYVAEEYIVHSPFGDLDQASLSGFFTALSTALTDFNMVRNQVVVEGNFAATRLTITGIFENDFAGPMGVLPPTGQPFTLEAVNIFRFDENGKIVEEWVQFDNLSFLTQLGAMGIPSESANTPVDEDMAAAFAERFDSIFNGGQVAVADEIFATEFVGHLPLAPELDLEGWKAYVLSFYAALSDLTQEVNQVIVAEDRVVLHVTYTGTHDGELFGIPATGNTVSMEGIGIFSFDEEGRAVENWAVIDVVGLLAQIGAFPPTE